MKKSGEWKEQNNSSMLKRKESNLLRDLRR
jgi:hypothetical protein